MIPVARKSCLLASPSWEGIFTLGFSQLWEHLELAGILASWNTRVPHWILLCERGQSNEQEMWQMKWRGCNWAAVYQKISCCGNQLNVSLPVNAAFPAVWKSCFSPRIYFPNYSWTKVWENQELNFWLLHSGWNHVEMQFLQTSPRLPSLLSELTSVSKFLLLEWKCSFLSLCSRLSSSSGSGLWSQNSLAREDVKPTRPRGKGENLGASCSFISQLAFFLSFSLVRK